MATPRIHTGYGDRRVLGPGDECPLLLTVLGVARTQDFTSSAPDVLAVEPDGHISKLVAKRPGTAVVTWARDGQTDAITLRVVDTGVVLGLKVELRMERHAPGEWRVLAESQHDHGHRADVSASPEVLWTSSDPGLVRFDGAPGVAYGPLDRAGEVTLTARYRGHAAPLEVALRQGELITLGVPFHFEHELLVGVKHWLTTLSRPTSRDGLADRFARATVEPADAAELGEQAGRQWLRPLRAGPLRVMVTLGRLRSEKTLPCVVSALALDPMRDSLGSDMVERGASFEAYAERAAGVPSFDVDLNVAWTCSRPDVLGLTVTETGNAKLQALAPGEATLTAELLPTGQRQTRTYRVFEPDNTYNF